MIDAFSVHYARLSVWKISCDPSYDNMHLISLSLSLFLSILFTIKPLKIASYLSDECERLFENLIFGAILYCILCMLDVNNNRSWESVGGVVFFSLGEGTVQKYGSVIFTLDVTMTPLFVSACIWTFLLFSWWKCWFWKKARMDVLFCLLLGKIISNKKWGKKRWCPYEFTYYSIIWWNFCLCALHFYSRNL